MTYRIEPAEAYDGRVSVHLLDDDAGREEIRCSSYQEAIDVVKMKQHDVTVAKIVNRDDEVVFSSQDIDIDDWQSVWESEKRRLSLDIEEYDCPYDGMSCFADDLCVQCKMDKLQNRLSPRPKSGEFRHSPRSGKSAAETHCIQHARNKLSLIEEFYRPQRVEVRTPH